MVKVIAEVGCNHKGNFDLAVKYIKDLKHIANADVVKFQKRNPRELLTEAEYNAPHPVPYNSYGKTYGEHREFLEFTAEQHAELKAIADYEGIEYSCSVWDVTSAMEIIALNPKMIKVPSPCNTSRRLLGHIFNNYDGEVHISLGMTTVDEEEGLYRFITSNKFHKKNEIYIYACTSGYPVDFRDVCLLEIPRIKEKWINIIKGAGFSGHHRGIAIDCIPVAMGVTHIERHVTFDPSWVGSDHSAALEMDGFRKLVRNIRASEDALGFKLEEILEVEKPNKLKLKRYF